MRFTSTAVAYATLGTTLVSAMPTIRQAAALSPCANITQQYARALAANASSFYASGQQAYECINSLPFEAPRASAFVLELIKYLNFQSTSPVLKNPPKTYLSPAVDLIGGMNAIFQKANTSQYQSQYQMDAEITSLITSAADGHLSVQLCSTQVFGFTLAPTDQLISVSANGTSVPEIYLYRDTVAAKNGSTISPVMKINGQNATQYLSKLGPSTGNQDPDAQYNNMFASNARGTANQGYTGSFIFSSGTWPGSPSIAITFANGTTYNSTVLAEVTKGFNSTNGTAVYSKYCLPPTSTATATSSSSATSSATSTTLPPPSSYPTPLIRDSNNLILGYYLNATGYNDTAVLLVPSFEAETTASQVEFANVASTFVNRAAADGKTKIIIDVSGNGGGTITSGFDLYKLFFPNNTADSYTRQIDHTAQRLTWKSYAQLNRTDGSSLLDLFNYKQQVTPDQTGNFSSWEGIYGPDNINGANMTNVYANFNYTFDPESSPIRGYGGVPLNVTKQLFRPENILILSDGHCSSTCTTFVNLMTNSTSPGFGNAKTITFGGRPINAPMQVMGGVRGAQSFALNNLAAVVDNAYVFAFNRTNSTTPPLTKSELALLAQTAPMPLTKLPFQFAGGSLNLRNSYNPGDLNTPLQFAYQASDCKLYYTYQNIINPASSWLSAATAAWGNGTCVPGSMSTKFKTS